MKDNMRAIFRYQVHLLAIAACLLQVAAAYAGSGTASEQFLALNPDPVSAAMGNGCLALRSSLPTAGINNPASLSGIPRAQLSLNHMLLPGEIKYNGASFALPTAYGNLGFSFMQVDYGLIDGYEYGYTGDPQRVSPPSSYDVAAVLSYAVPISKTVPVPYEFGALGVNLKFLHSKLAYYAAEAIALDLGAIYHMPFIKGLSAGFAYRNIGSTVKYATVTNSLPAAFNYGLGYANRKFLNLSVTADCFTGNGSSSYAAGISVSPAHFMAVRAGWKTPASDHGLLSGLTGGVGLKVAGVSFDYAVAPANDLSPLHQLSVNLPVGNIFRLETAADYYLQQHFQEASDAYYEKNYIDARNQFEDILAIYPDHRPSQKYLERIAAAMDGMEQDREALVIRWLRNAGKAMLKKDYITAGRYYTRVIEVDPENSSAKAGQDDIEQLMAVVRQEKVKEKNKGKISALWGKATRRYLKGDYVTAREEFNEILAIDPLHKEAKNYIVEIDNQLTKIASSRINELFAQGSSLYRQGHYREAMKFFEAVAIAAPYRLDAQEMAVSCQKNIDEKAAQVRAEKVAGEQAQVKNEMSSVFDRALRYYEKGHYEAALDNFQKSEEMAVRYEFKEYLADSRRYLSLIKSSLSEKYYRIGFDNFRANKFEPAAEAYRKSLEYSPENTSARVELERIGTQLAQQYFEEGMAFFSKNDMEKARAMFKKSLRYQPDKAESLRALERIN